MKTLVAALLCSSLAFADPPVDAPIADVPDTSVHVFQGEPVPFEGRLLSLDENTRRGKALVDCKATLGDAETSLLISKPLFVAIIVGAVVASAAIAAGATYAATRPK